MRHKDRIARNRLNFLWKQIVDQERLSTSDNVVSDTGLAEYDITRLARNFETIDDEASNLSQTPPILFVPLPLTKLRAHPIEPESLELKKFRDYVPDGSTWSRPSHCARNAAMYLESCMRRFRTSLAEGSACPYFLAAGNLEPLWSVSSPPCILV